MARLSYMVQPRVYETLCLSHTVSGATSFVTASTRLDGGFCARGPVTLRRVSGPYRYRVVGTAPRGCWLGGRAVPDLLQTGVLGSGTCCPLLHADHAGSNDTRF